MNLNFISIPDFLSDSVNESWEVFIYSLTVAAIFWVIAAAVIMTERRILKKGQAPDPSSLKAGA
ncbi:MAG: hypothetical protein R6W78_07955 [Bacteroidales bacterium]